jgi:hypothetical protein
MLSAIINVLQMIIGTVIDVITLPFRAVIALLSGAKFEFRQVSKPRQNAHA